MAVLQCLEQFTTLLSVFNVSAPTIDRNCPTECDGRVQIGRIGGVGGASFDNSYYRSLLESDRVGLGTDQALVRDPETRPIVQEFAANNQKFVDEFRTTYVKLSNLTA